MPAWIFVCSSQSVQTIIIFAASVMLESHFVQKASLFPLHHSVVVPFVRSFMVIFHSILLPVTIPRLLGRSFAQVRDRSLYISDLLIDWSPAERMFYSCSTYHALIASLVVRSFVLVRRPDPGISNFRGRPFHRPK